ncbi:MAG TPA: RNA polymerase sigma factor [Planctomycetota bacterium]|nr:RNA polymerase sigma factor [Planctomycetota bacterium]
MPLDERTLVEHASRGDRGAVEELLALHLPRLRAYVRLHAGPALLRRESDEDLVQSVCREALQGLDRFEYRGEAQFRGWLFTAAARKIANRHAYWHAEQRDAARLAPPRRATDASNDGELEQACRSLSTPSRKLVTAEEIARIEGALGGLSEERREIVLLSRVLGLSHREIAERTERSEAACRVLLSRALAELARALTQKSAK